ncbi:MAG: hypothetical protein IKT33_03980 [Clostridia bacterium]|nr:hypothetical protein [Clostridia bacterium]
MKKLTKLSENFYQMGLTKAEKADFQVLDSFLEGFFPNIDMIEKSLKTFCDNDIRKVLRLRVQKNKEYNIENMMLLSHHDKWLAGYFQFYIMNNFNAVFSQIAQKDLIKNSTANVVKKYVQKSPKFKVKRNEFEQNVVMAYIQNWAANNFATDFYCKQEQKWAMSYSVNFDKEFRNKVKMAMHFLNISAESIEAGIERTARYWRKDAMKLAFQNYYRKSFREEFDFNTTDAKKKKYMNQWLALRQREYFDEHKTSIKKYGRPTKAMLMKQKAADFVRKELEIWEDHHEMEMRGVECIY